MPDLESLYEEMSDLTKPECATRCRLPFSCCDRMYCEEALRFAALQGVELLRTEHPGLPLMGPNGCTAPPYLRPLCTVHTCEIASLGFKRGDDVWTKKYWALREALDAADTRQYSAPGESPGGYLVLEG